jgi:hypothetical protein
MVIASPKILSIIFLPDIGFADILLVHVIT